MFGTYLSFPAALLPGMKQADLIQTHVDAANALAALNDEIGKQPIEPLIASVSETALRVPAWGGKHAGRESRFVLECAKQLEQLIASEITDVVICGNSAAVSQGYSLETSAALEGWHLFNIFGLPYTLESAAAHMISVALAARGARLAVSSGESSGPAALQFVESMLAENPSGNVIWGATEQFSEGVKAVLSAEGRSARSRCLPAPRLHFEGSILFSVTALRTNASAFEVKELHDLQSTEDLFSMLVASTSAMGEAKPIYYVNSAAMPAVLQANVSSEDIVDLHNRFGDGWSINPFVPFLHMLTQPGRTEFLIVLSDGHSRWQLLRALRLVDG